MERDRNLELLSENRILEFVNIEEKTSKERGLLYSGMMPIPTLILNPGFGFFLEYTWKMRGFTSNHILFYFEASLHRISLVEGMKSKFLFHVYGMK